jgi:threonine dehydratase
MTRMVAAPTNADLAYAHEVVRTHVRPTPLIDSTVAADALLKLECLQPTGSFKIRGALAALARLTPATGVVTASAGNHGLGVAYAATRLGLAATVVVPTTASPSKVGTLREFPINLVEHGDDYDAAERRALDLPRRDRPMCRRTTTLLSSRARAPSGLNFGRVSTAPSRSSCRWAAAGSWLGWVSGRPGNQTCA